MESKKNCFVGGPQIKKSRPVVVEEKIVEQVFDKNINIISQIASTIFGSNSPTKTYEFKNKIKTLCGSSRDQDNLNSKYDLSLIDDEIIKSSPKKKIAVMLQHTKLYGGIRRFFEIGNVLLSRGHDYRIYCHEDSVIKWMKYDGKIYPFNEIFNEKFDVVMSGHPPTFSKFDCVDAKLKLLHVIGRKNYKKIYDIYYNNKNITMIGNSSDWLAYFPYMRGYTVPGAVNTNFFFPVDSPSDEKFIIMAYGRPGQLKGFEDIVEAIKLLDSSKYKLRLLNLEEVDVNFNGIDVEYVVGYNQDELRRLYCTSNIFVSFEDDGGWSNTSIESMACGTPVICNTIGTTDFAIPFYSALVVPHGEIDTIANAIQLMRDVPALYMYLRKNCVEMARLFSWEKYCLELEKIFFIEIDAKKEIL